MGITPFVKNHGKDLEHRKDFPTHATAPLLTFRLFRWLLHASDITSEQRTIELLAEKVLGTQTR